MEDNSCDNCGEESELYHHEDTGMALCEACVTLAEEGKLEAVVYECWVSGPHRSHESSGFTKLDEWPDVLEWLSNYQLTSSNIGDHIHIVSHRLSEYKS